MYDAIIFNIRITDTKKRLFIRVFLVLLVRATNVRMSMILV